MAEAIAFWFDANTHDRYSYEGQDVWGIVIETACWRTTGTKSRSSEWSQRG